MRKERDRAPDEVGEQLLPPREFAGVGALEAEDLPEAWNKAVRGHLGLDVPDIGQGCLQDIHWFKGSFGYFPCYGLGHLYAAQLYAKAQRDIPDFGERFLEDQSAAMTDFLSWHVYSKANSKPGLAIMEEAFGAPLDPAYFLDYVRAQADSCALPRAASA